MTFKIPNSTAHRFARPVVSLAFALLLWLALFLQLQSARSRGQDLKELVIEGGGERIVLAGKIAFVATATGRKEIYVCNADGTGVRRITADKGLNVSPALSADGRRLAHTGYGSGYADIYHVDLATGARRRVVKAPGTNSGAAFSPDGRRIALTMSFVGNPEIFVTSIGSSDARRITDTPGVETSPSWSPDGRRIVYSSDAGGRPQLFTISSSGGTPRKISTGHRHCTEPSWSPDGTKIAFNVRQGRGYAVAVHELSSGRTRIVGRGEDPSWGPDSRHIVFSTGRSLILLDSETGATTTIVSKLGKISEPNWSRSGAPRP